MVCQIDAFTISATRNIQYVFTKLVCLIVFVEDILDIFLNDLLYALPSNKKYQNSTNFQIHVNCVAMETIFCIQIKELNTSKGWFVCAELLKHY